MSQITVEKTAEDSASKSLRVTVPVDRVREAEAKALKYYVQRARLPGFRPGKAPEAVVRKRFGDAIRQTVLEEVIRESWETAKTTEVAQADHRSVHPEPQVRGRRARSSSTSWWRSGPSSSWSGPAASGSSAGWPPVADARGRGAAGAAAGAEGHLDPGRGREARARARWCGSRWRRSRRASAGAAQPYDLVLGQNQAIPDLEERIMTLLPGRERRRRGAVPRRSSRRGRRGQTRAGAGHAARGEAAGAARRSTTPSRARSATSRPSTRSAPRSAQDLEREAAREADAQVRQALVQQIVEANDVAGARVAGAPAACTATPRCTGCRRSSCEQFEQQFHAGRRGAGPARPGARRGGRGQRRSGPPRRSWTRGSRELAAARGVPAGELYGSLAEGQAAARARARPSPRRRPSPGSSRSPPSKR